MTWLRLDDGFARHRKVAPLSDCAFRLHATAMLECCAQLTDGFIAQNLPGTWPSAPRGKKLEKIISELVHAQLWEITEKGWLVNDFLDWNPSAQKVTELREKRSKAGRAGGKASTKPGAKDKQNVKQVLEQNESKTEANLNPVPVPVPLEDPPIPPAGGETRLLDLAGRSKMFLQSKGDAQTIALSFGEPCRWPEVIATFRAFEKHLGAPQEVRTSADSRVHALLTWFAAGYDRHEIAEVFELAAKEDFWREKPLSQLLKSTSRLDELRQKSKPDTIDPDRAKRMAAREAQNLRSRQKRQAAAAAKVDSSAAVRSLSSLTQGIGG